MRRKTSFRPKVGSVLIALALVLSLLPVFTIQVAATPVTAVSVDPSTQTVSVGDTFTVSIAVDPAEPISGIALELRFDPSLVKATKVAVGGLGMDLWVKTRDNVGGVVTLAGGLLEGGTVSSPGTLATITFVSKATGMSGLTIENLEVLKYSNGTPTLVPSTSENGSVTVTLEQEIEGTAEVSLLNFPPEVLGVVPSETDWDPWEAYTIAVTVRDNNTLADLDNVVVMAYSGPLGPADPDSTRSHYTWWYDGSWHSSLGAGYIVPENCSAPDPSENEGAYVFAVRLAKTAKPGAWDLYAGAVDKSDNRGSLENAGAVSVWVYTEFSLDRHVLRFAGRQGDTVGPELGPSVVTVTTNDEFDIEVRLSGPWTTDSLVMPMDTTSANGITLTDSYQKVWTGVGHGEDVAKEIAWELAIPIDQPLGEYRTTFHVNVAH